MSPRSIVVKKARIVSRAAIPLKFANAHSAFSVPAFALKAPAMRDDTRQWIENDHAHCWHPFTRQSEWCADPQQTLVITHGKGAWLYDSDGRRYLDGNSSIWTNIHGHAHPSINAAIASQLEQAAHTSFLGFTHPNAIELAERLCAFFPKDSLERVFFSDNGSTAIECALKMAIQYRIDRKSVV